MTTDDAVLKIRQLMRRGLELPMHGCCSHKKEYINFYLDPCKHRHFDYFRLKEYLNGFYLGCFKDGNRYGFGYFVWNNGDIYAGHWEDDEKNEDGAIINFDGSMIFGEFKNGNLNGRCITRGNNGIEVEADYDNGKRIKVWPSSDEFIDSKTGDEYTRKNHFYGSNPISGCLWKIAIVVIILTLIDMCA